MSVFQWDQTFRVLETLKVFISQETGSLGASFAGKQVFRGQDIFGAPECSKSNDPPASNVSYQQLGSNLPDRRGF